MRETVRLGIVPIPGAQAYAPIIRDCAEQLHDEVHESERRTLERNAKAGDIATSPAKSAIIFEPSICGTIAKRVNWHHVWIRERFANNHAPTRFHHSREFAQRCVLIWNLAEHGHQIRSIECVIVVWKVLCVTLLRGDICDLLFGCSLFETTDHFLLGVDHVERSTRSDPFCGSKSVIPGPWSDLEDPFTGLWFERSTKSPSLYERTR